MPMSRSLGGTKMPLSDRRRSASPMTMRAGVGPLEPGEAAQRRGLAAARRPEQRDQLAVLDADVDAVDGIDHDIAGRNEGLVQVFDREHTLTF